MMSHLEKSVHDSVEHFLDREKRLLHQGEAIPVKDTNPKDMVATDKLPLGVVPDSVIAYASLAWTEGMLKYGRYNWRIAGVRGSIYHDALQRHRIKYWNGEWADPQTKVPHLASIMACAGILLEAHLIGNITDDRPPACPELVSLIDDLQANVVHLKEMLKDRHPHQYTLADTVPTQPEGTHLKRAS